MTSSEGAQSCLLAAEFSFCVRLLVPTPAAEIDAQGMGVAHERLVTNIVASYILRSRSSWLGGWTGDTCH